MVKMYITKYALTSGIQEYYGVMFADGTFSIPGTFDYFRKGEFFESREDAENNAEERRIKKLKSLDKQIKRISALVF